MNVCKARAANFQPPPPAAELVELGFTGRVPRPQEKAGLHLDFQNAKAMANIPNQGV